MTCTACELPGGVFQPERQHTRLITRCYNPVPTCFIDGDDSCTAETSPSPISVGREGRSCCIQPEPNPSVFLGCWWTGAGVTGGPVATIDVRGGVVFCQGRGFFHQGYDRRDLGERILDLGSLIRMTVFTTVMDRSGRRKRPAADTLSTVL